MAHVTKRNPNRCPTHPGALLREDVIPATGKTKADIAQLLGISRQHLYDILRERKPVSPGVAVRFGKLFGDGAGVWVRMQAAYDTWHAEREEDVTGIPTLPREPHEHRRVMPAVERTFDRNWRLRRVKRHNIAQNRTVARPTRFERVTVASGGQRSIRVPATRWHFPVGAYAGGGRRGGCNVAATLPLSADPKTSPPLTSSIH
jgi:addiction module HigA family antidote